METNLKRTASDALRNEHPPKKPNLTRSISEGDVYPLSDLLVTAGDLSVARLHEDHANEEVERCRVELRNALKIQNYASLTELKEATLERAVVVSKQRQDQVTELSARAKRFSSLLRDGRDSREQHLISKITESVKSSFRSELQSKDELIQSKLQQSDELIQDLRFRLDQAEEAQKSQVVLHKKEVDSLKIVIGNLNKDIGDRVQKVIDEQEAKISTVSSDIDALRESYRLQAINLSAKDERYALSGDLKQFIDSTEDVNISSAEAISRLTKQMETALKNVETIAVLRKDYSSMSTQLTSIDEVVKQHWNESEHGSHDKSSSVVNATLETLKREVKDLRENLGVPGDGQGTEASGLWQMVHENLGNLGDEDGVVRTGLWGYMADVGFSGREGVTSGLFSAVEKMQDEITTIVNTRTLNLQDANLLVEKKDEELSTRFDAVLSDLVQKQNATTGEKLEQISNELATCLSTTKQLESDVEMEFTGFEQQIATLLEDFLSSKQRIDYLEKVLSETNMAVESSALHETRLKQLEENCSTARKQASENASTAHPQSPSITVDAKYDNIKNDLEIVQEACRSLEDRYNNTTSDEMVSRMLREFNTRYGFHAYVNQVNSISQALTVVHRKLQGSKQRLDLMSNDLARRVPAIEEVVNGQNVSLTNCVQHSTLQASDLHALHETLAKHIANATKGQEAALQAYEALESKFSSTTAEPSQHAQIKELGRIVNNWDNRVGDIETQVEDGEKRIAQLESNRSLDTEENRRKHEANEQKSGALRVSVNEALKQISSKVDIDTFDNSVKLHDAKFVKLQEDIMQNKRVCDGRASHAAEPKTNGTALLNTPASHKPPRPSREALDQVKQEAAPRPAVSAACRVGRPSKPNKHPKGQTGEAILLSDQTMGYSD